MGDKCACEKRVLLWVFGTAGESLLWAVGQHAGTPKSSEVPKPSREAEALNA